MQRCARALRREQQASSNQTMGPRKGTQPEFHMVNVVNIQFFIISPNTVRWVALCARVDADKQLAALHNGEMIGRLPIRPLTKETDALRKEADRVRSTGQ